MYYLRARYYDPATGRFIGKDPLPIGNRYSYVGNDPVNWVDPSGLCAFGAPCPVDDIVDCVSNPIECAEDVVDEVFESFVDTFGPPYDFPKILNILDVLPTQLVCGAIAGAVAGPGGAFLATIVCEVYIGFGNALIQGSLIYESNCSLETKIVAGVLVVGNAFIDINYGTIYHEIAAESALSMATTSLLDCDDPSDLGDGGGHSGGGKE